MSTNCAADSNSRSQESPQLNWGELRSSALNSIKTQEIPDNIELPALPQAVTEFVDQSASPDFEFPKLAAIIEKDAGLTCELLRYVNSAAVGLSAPMGRSRSGRMVVPALWVAT